MSKFKAFRVTGDYITPGGIKIGLQGLMGIHQKQITYQDEARRKKGLNDILADCITSIGNKKSVTIKDINMLLDGDRKATLFELRMLSNKRNPLFVFDYEFPVLNQQKRTQKVEVLFNAGTFPQRPYRWVYDEMIREWKKANDINESEILNDSQLDDVFLESKTNAEGIHSQHAKPFAVMYEDYQTLIDDHLKQVIKLDECGVEIHWKLITAEASNNNNIQLKDVTSHTQIQVHDPVYYDTDIDKMSKTTESVPIGLNLDEMTNNDIEELRGHILQTEAKIDTSVVVQYKDQADMQAQVDLVSTPAFFFPSMGR